MIVAVSMVRDEADIIGWTIGHLLAQGVDRVLVADNRSVDGTGDLIRDWFDDRVQVIDDPDPCYTQGQKMTVLAQSIAEPGDWVIPFDADEAWCHIDRLRDLDADVVNTHPFVHVPQRADDDSQLNPLLRVRYRVEDGEKFPKVAFRWRPGVTIAMGNHAVSGAGACVVSGTLDVRHYQYRSLEQVRRKVTNGVEAYGDWGRREGFGSHWRELAERDDLADWWINYMNQPVRYDPCPQ